MFLEIKVRSDFRSIANQIIGLYHVILYTKEPYHVITHAIIPLYLCNTPPLYPWRECSRSFHTFEDFWEITRNLTHPWKGPCGYRFIIIIQRIGNNWFIGRRKMLPDITHAACDALIWPSAPTATSGENVLEPFIYFRSSRTFHRRISQYHIIFQFSEILQFLSIQL